MPAQWAAPRWQWAAGETEMCHHLPLPPLLGPAYLWHWRNDAYTILAGGHHVGCHDLQLSAARDDTAFWSPMPETTDAATGAVSACSGTGDGRDAALIDISRAAELARFDMSSLACADVNHLQVVTALRAPSKGAIGCHRVSQGANHLQVVTALRAPSKGAIGCHRVSQGANHLQVVHCSPRAVILLSSRCAARASPAGGGWAASGAAACAGCVAAAASPTPVPACS